MTPILTTQPDPPFWASERVQGSGGAGTRAGRRHEGQAWCDCLPPLSHGDCISFCPRRPQAIRQDGPPTRPSCLGDSTARGPSRPCEHPCGHLAPTKAQPCLMPRKLHTSNKQPRPSSPPHHRWAIPGRGARRCLTQPGLGLDHPWKEGGTRQGQITGPGSPAPSLTRPTPTLLSPSGCSGGRPPLSGALGPGPPPLGVIPLMGLPAVPQTHGSHPSQDLGPLTPVSTTDPTPCVQSIASPETPQGGCWGQRTEGHPGHQPHAKRDCSYGALTRADGVTLETERRRHRDRQRDKGAPAGILWVMTG